MDCSCGQGMRITGAEPGNLYWCAACGSLGERFPDGRQIILHPKLNAGKPEIDGPRIGVRLWLAGQALAAVAGSVARAETAAEMALGYADALIAAAQKERANDVS